MRYRIEAFVIVAAVVTMIVLIIAARHPEPYTQYQVVEKGKYSRIQYDIMDNLMTPEFKSGYYYVLRDYQTGEEIRVNISEDQYEACVVGDTVE